MSRIDVDAATAATNGAIETGDIAAIRTTLAAERRERALEAAEALRRAYERNKALAAECSHWLALLTAQSTETE